MLRGQDTVVRARLLPIGAAMGGGLLVGLSNELVGAVGAAITVYLSYASSCASSRPTA
jgi:hypothetical protein